MSAEPDRTHQKPAFLKRVRIRNYKSIKFCDVELEPLTVLVGRNGSGKSNFVDALGFLRDVVTKNLSIAIDDHGSRHRLLYGSATTGCIEFAIVAEVDDHMAGRRMELEYEIAVDFPSEGGGLLSVEKARMRRVGDPPSVTRLGFEVRHTREVADVEFIGDEWPKLTPMNGIGLRNRSFLGFLAEPRLLQFADLLSRVLAYNFAPHEFRIPTESQPDTYLDPRGIHLPSVITTTRNRDPWLIERVSQYLKVITETVEFKRVLPLVSHETLEFHVRANGSSFDLPAASMSDGTLRALATLVAVFQETYAGPPSLVAIEEPETSLHPAASAALVDALDEATGRTQVLITTHSTELLDNETIRPDNIRVVEMIDGETVVAKVDEATVEIVERRLDSLGGLELQNQLHANYADLRRQKALQEEGR